MLKRTFVLGVTLLCITFLLACNSAKDVKIGIIQVIDHPALNSARQGFIEYLSENGYAEGETVEYDYRNAKGSMENAHQIAAGFIGKGVNLIMAIGTPVTKVTIEKTQEIPIIFAAVTDPLGEGIVTDLKTPGGNVSGISDMNPVYDQLKLIKEMIPQAKKVGVLFNPGEANSVALVNIAREAADKLGLQLIEATANNTRGVRQAAASMVGKVDAAYMPTDNTMAAAIDVIMDVCDKNNIPFFSSERESVKDGGTLASLCVNYYQLGRQTGEIAYRVLKGEDIGKISVEFQKKFDLYVNTTRAEKLNIEVPKSVRERATKIVK